MLKCKSPITHMQTASEPTQSFVTLLILLSPLNKHLTLKRHPHAVNLYLPYLRLSCHNVNNHHSLFLPCPTFSSVSHPLQLSFSFTRHPKRSLRCPSFPSPFYVWDIDILHKSDAPLSITEQELMTEGCDRRGLVPAESYRSLARYALESVFV